MFDIGLFRGLITVLTLAVFLGICWWAFRPSSRRRFERDAMIPFEEHPESSPRSPEPGGSGGSDQRDASDEKDEREPS
jgi:cytochrome c oxidase cbb3-type subunit 4